MRQSKFTETQIVSILKEADAGRPVNAYVFESLEQVRAISAEWLQSYNEERPHDALAGLPPAVYRAQLEARSSP